MNIIEPTGDPNEQLEATRKVSREATKETLVKSIPIALKPINKGRAGEPISSTPIFFEVVSILL